MPLFFAKQKDAQLEFTNKRAVLEYLLANIDYKGYYTIEIEKEKSKRTLNQNSYLFGVVYRAIADHTGHTVNEVHEIMKRLLLPPTFIKYQDKEIKIPGSTATLNKVQFGEYIDRIRAEVAPMGIIIPEALTSESVEDIQGELDSIRANLQVPEGEVKF